MQHNVSSFRYGSQCIAQNIIICVPNILFFFLIFLSFQSLLSHIDSVLYVDTDTLFLSPVSDIWHFFSEFNSTQIAGLSPEHEDRNVGWYNRFAKHPFYGPMGLNSGVMLMNLTRMRKFKWEEYILPLYKEFKLKITWGDQDLINILFYYHPGMYVI